MTDEPPPPPTRAEARKSARARREYKAGVRQVYFQALASGFPIEEIAAIGGVSVRTVRREIDRAIAARRLDAPEAYVHLQVARLTKALRLTDAAIDRGHLRAIVPHMKLVAALDRYHGLSALKAPPLPEEFAAPASLAPAAPLRLARAAPALEEATILAREPA